MHEKFWKKENTSLFFMKKKWKVLLVLCPTDVPRAPSWSASAVAATRTSATTARRSGIPTRPVMRHARRGMSSSTCLCPRPSAPTVSTLIKTVFFFCRSERSNSEYTNKKRCFFLPTPERSNSEYTNKVFLGLNNLTLKNFISFMDPSCLIFNTISKFTS